MADWKDELERIIFDKQSSQPTEDTPAVEDVLQRYIDDVVIPAFTELKAQMEQHGRTVQVRKEGPLAAITVFFEDKEEFSMAVRARVYRRGADLFPTVETSERDLDLKAEVVLYGGTTQEQPLDSLTHQRIIDAFVKAYDHWVDWSK